MFRKLSISTISSRRASSAFFSSSEFIGHKLVEECLPQFNLFYWNKSSGSPWLVYKHSLFWGKSFACFGSEALKPWDRDATLSNNVEFSKRPQAERFDSILMRPLLGTILKWIHGIKEDIKSTNTVGSSIQISKYPLAQFSQPLLSVITNLYLLRILHIPLDLWSTLRGIIAFFLWEHCTTCIRKN